MIGLQALMGAAIAPTLLILWYFYRRDLNPEPRGALARTFGLGVVICFPAMVLELLNGLVTTPLQLSPLPAALNEAVLCAALVEESLKFAILYFFVRRLPAFDEPMDGIVYGVTASLGFATLENILYVADGGVGVAMMRAMTSVPGHAVWGAIMGFYLAKATFGPAAQRGRQMFLAWLVPLALHGLYDFPLMWQSKDDTVGWALWAVPVSVVACWRWVARMVRELNEDQRLAKGETSESAVAAAPTQGSKILAAVRIVFGGLLTSWGALACLVTGAAVVFGGDPDVSRGDMAVGGVIIGGLPLALGLWLFVGGMGTLTAPPVRAPVPVSG